MANKQNNSPDEQSELSAKIGKEARLWGLAVVCAAFGALAVWRFNSLWVGIGVFLVVFLILGMALYNYEKRRGDKES